jgi:hypothetical protein
MANSTVPITPGAGVGIDSHQIGNGDQQQIIRTAKVDTRTPNQWTVSTTAAAVIAADENRVGMTMYNASTVRVYIAYNSAATVTAATADWFLDSGDRWEVPDPFCQMAMSFLAASAGTGTLNVALGTDS